MNAINMVSAIFDYFDDKHLYQGSMVVGSLAEMMEGLSAEPRDIDVIVILMNEYDSEYETTLYLPECGTIPVNVNFIKHETFRSELHSLEPKYLCYVASSSQISMKLLWYFNHTNSTSVRKNISRASDRAWDKGRKKLVKPLDYDPVLGLKNLYHAFKFPIMAKWRLYDFDLDEDYIEFFRELDMIFLDTVRKNMENIYYSTEGTLDERCRAVIEYAKPLYNKLMTEFKLMFPKG